MTPDHVTKDRPSVPGVYSEQCYDDLLFEEKKKSKLFPSLSHFHATLYPITVLNICKDWVIATLLLRMQHHCECKRLDTTADCANRNRDWKTEE